MVDNDPKYKHPGLEFGHLTPRAKTQLEPGSEALLQGRSFVYPNAPTRRLTQKRSQQLTNSGKFTVFFSFFQMKHYPSLSGIFKHPLERI